MATVDDLVPLAVAGMFEDASAAAVEGSDWSWLIDVDISGSAVDFTGSTGVCKVADAIDGTLLVTLTVTMRTTGVTISAANSLTGALATAANNGTFRRCTWSCLITSGTGKKVHLWGPAEFRILPSLGV